MPERFAPTKDDPREQAKRRPWPSILMAFGTVIVLANIAMVATCELDTMGHDPCSSAGGGFCIDRRDFAPMWRSLGAVGSLTGLVAIAFAMRAKRRWRGSAENS
jgi:hypothetical protein